jgi:hypothetical protein
MSFAGDAAWITWGALVGLLGLQAIPLISLEVRRFVHRYDPVYGPVERVVKTQADVSFGAFRWHISYWNATR